MYKQINSIVTGELDLVVKRLSDNSYIPFDPANTDYQEYLEWIAAGNEPEPAD